MAIGAKLQGRKPDNTEKLAAVLLAMLIVGNIVQAARIYDLFWEDASRFGYLAQAIPVVVYAAIALSRRHWVSVIATLAMLLVVMGSHTQFIRLSGAQTNYNSVATFVPLLTFVAFTEAKFPLERTIRFTLIISCVYLLSYIVLDPIIRRYFASNAFILLQGHGSNQSRLYLAAAYAAFVMLYGLRAYGAPLFLRAGLILLGGVTLWMSDTRAMILIVMAVFGLGALNLLIRPVRVAIFGVVAFGILLMLLGFIFTDWNPYSTLITDDSGAYRAIEYSWVTRVLEHNWLYGVGTPGKFIDLQLYLQREFSVPRSIWIFASDLGVLGVYFQFGLAGLIGFVTAIVFLMVSRWKTTTPEIQALQMTAFACAVYGITSPLIIMEPSSLFLMLMVASAWRDRRELRSGMPAGDDEAVAPPPPLRMPIPRVRPRRSR